MNITKFLESFIPVLVFVILFGNPQREAINRIPTLYNFIRTGNFSRFRDNVWISLWTRFRLYDVKIIAKEDEIINQAPAICLDEYVSKRIENYSKIIKRISKWSFIMSLFGFLYSGSLMHPDLRIIMGKYVPISNIHLKESLVSVASILLLYIGMLSSLRSIDLEVAADLRGPPKDITQLSERNREMYEKVVGSDKDDTFIPYS